MAASSLDGAIGGGRPCGREGVDSEHLPAAAARRRTGRGEAARGVQERASKRDSQRAKSRVGALPEAERLSDKET
jgi:hypothetical protein